MNLYTQPHLTHSVIMVYPNDFGYNAQTGADNEFQVKPKTAQNPHILAAAQDEFCKMMEQLDGQGIEVILLKEKHTQAQLPDAIFPNNWFSTRNDGRLFIYPMKTPNRQAEVQIEPLVSALAQKGYAIEQLIDLRNEFKSDWVLEGTGSLIFHHKSGKVFATVSQRCRSDALCYFAESYGYQFYQAESRSKNSQPIYHTNVLMSCGDDFSVIAKDCLANNQQSNLFMDALSSCSSDIIVISEAQMARSFCSNILQLINKRQQKHIVMSSSAYRGFTLAQRQQLEKHGEFIICDIPTIETIGGGSARCMLAENFLPQSSKL